METDLQPQSNTTAFLKLGDSDLAALRPHASILVLKDGEAAFRAGDAGIDLFIVESGSLEILNPADHNSHIVTHEVGSFAGDIDLLTGRPVIVTGVARGETKLLRIPNQKIREVLNKFPGLSEKMLIAIQERRRMLTQVGTLGLKMVGPANCRDTSLAKEFLYKNFVPFTWHDSASDEGQELLKEFGSPRQTPVVHFDNGILLINPTLRELAQTAGVWKNHIEGDVDLAIVGAGPAGMAAAIYAASEGLVTTVLDRLGPGGQAAGSSKIENLIGFPSGLSGADFATRGVLQMLKFGATMAAPVRIEKIDAAKTSKDYHVLHLDCGSTLRARTVLIASGVQWRKLGATNAERYDAAGIHYACTSVEAITYDTKDVAVVGAGNSAGQAAMYLSECCRDRTVHLIIRRRLGPGMSSYLVNRIRAAVNIVVHEGAEISEVHGGRTLEQVTLKAFNPDNDESKIEVTSDHISVSAIFVFIGADPGCSWLPKEIVRDKLGYLLTGSDVVREGKWTVAEREPCPLETSVPGILAAGDIRAGSTKRVGFAVGDGSLAVTCVHKLIAIQQ